MTTHIRVLVLDDDIMEVTEDLNEALELFGNDVKLRPLVDDESQTLRFMIGSHHVSITFDPYGGKDPQEVARRIEKNTKRYELVLLDDHWDQDPTAGQRRLLGPVVLSIKGPLSLPPVIALFSRLWRSKRENWKGYLNRVADITKDRPQEDLIFDGLEKNDVGHLNLLFRLAIQRRRMVDRRLDAMAPEKTAACQNFEKICQDSDALRPIWRSIMRAAVSSAPVLILGETGTGKEMVAESIRLHDQKTGSPYWSVNCAELTGDTVLSTLFGHVAGAFTGAVKPHIGVFEAHNGGTVFLDEIAELDLSVQAKLLRVIQDGKVTRLGSTEKSDAKVRIIAATNKPIEQMVTDGRFRHDLYERLKTHTIKLPSLRERASDLISLANSILQQIALKEGKLIQGFTAAAVRLLQSYPWPGNVRELELSLVAAVADIVAFKPEATEVDVEMLPDVVRQYQSMTHTTIVGGAMAAPVTSSGKFDNVDIAELQRTVTAIATTRGKAINNTVKDIGRMIAGDKMYLDPRMRKAVLARFALELIHDRRTREARDLFNALFGLQGTTSEGGLRQFLQLQSRNDPKLYPPIGKTFRLHQLYEYGRRVKEEAGIELPEIAPAAGV